MVRRVGRPTVVVAGAGCGSDLGLTSDSSCVRLGFSDMYVGSFVVLLFDGH